ncbi:replicative DNA helicase [Sphingoaurantiacus capsulatus]|uniref:Replicative DNA helicase n=1 Tax=Sphingoaurantiacus capsulatus TaxID=1771310 RepID=A0ABV7X969_9SPHN
MAITPLRSVANDSTTPPSLPQNLDTEAALLGALLIDNRLIEDVQSKLRPEHFFSPLNGRIYELILRVADRNQIATAVTLRPMLFGDPEFADTPSDYLIQLINVDGGASALIAATDFANQIYDLALLRELVRVGREMVTSATDLSEDIDPQAKVQEAEMALYKVAEQGEVTGSVKDFKTSAMLAVDMAQRAIKSGGSLSGITTGLEGLNAKIGGLHRSDLVILAGRPAMGKTALATNIAFSAAQRLMKDKDFGTSATESAGAGVAFFSLEMSSDQLATRILAEQSGLSSEALRMGKISQNDFRHLARAAADLENLPLYIDDTPGLTIAALRTRARRLKRQRGIGLIVVDYLQLLQGTSKSSGDNRVQEISEITRGLKTLAKELNVPVLALSQLSRAVEQREDKRPLLSDLRESGTIEQDADIVMFVYREEYYHATKKPEDGTEKFQAWLDKAHKVEGRAECIVAKQRHGSTGIVPMMFHKMTTKFSDIVDEGYLPDQYE